MLKPSFFCEGGNFMNTTRRFIGVIFAVVVVALLAGCGGSVAPSSPPAQPVLIQVVSQGYTRISVQNPAGVNIPASLGIADHSTHNMIQSCDMIFVNGVGGNQQSCQQALALWSETEYEACANDPARYDGVNHNSVFVAKDIRINGVLLTRQFEGGTATSGVGYCALFQFDKDGNVK